MKANSSNGDGSSSSRPARQQPAYESTGIQPEPLTQHASQYIEKQIERQKANATTAKPSRPLSDYAAKPSTQFIFSLSDFTLYKTLGTGTFGRVHLAMYNENSRYFAVKVLKKREILRFSQVEHVYCEKHLLSHLKNPFIVSLYAVFQNTGSLFMVMEYVIGGELFSYLRKATRFCQYTTIFYAAEIVLALEYLHSYDIVYRDLKPENLLIDASGHIKLTDFGFAKVLYRQKTWTLCGTPEYLAPEIILGKGHDRAVDWWALGILVFEMLAGYPPFFDQDNFVIYEKILRGTYVFPSYIDEVARDFIRRLLIGDPAMRMGSKGTADIKEHPFFVRVNWQDFAARKGQPPFVPHAAHPGDTNNFEVYEEEKLDAEAAAAAKSLSPQEQAIFRYF